LLAPNFDTTNIDISITSPTAIKGEIIDGNGMTTEISLPVANINAVVHHLASIQPITNSGCETV
jgi:hypothetical protein